MRTQAFFLQYILSPRKVGAIFPSSSYLAEKMISNIYFQNANYIVEYGPGTGVFTDQVLKYRKSDTIVLLMESNREFYKLLKDKYKEENNLIIVNDTAEHVDRYVERYGIPYVDYIISGLPFASLPKSVSNNILHKTKELLGHSGGFSTFQYTLFKKEVISQFFNQVHVKFEYRNVPPAFILSCNNQQLNIKSNAQA